MFGLDDEHVDKYTFEQKPHVVNQLQHDVNIVARKRQQQHGYTYVVLPSDASKKSRISKKITRAQQNYNSLSERDRVDVSANFIHVMSKIAIVITYWLKIRANDIVRLNTMNPLARRGVGRISTVYLKIEFRSGARRPTDRRLTIQSRV